MPVQYAISLPDPAAAKGPDPDLSFNAHGADAFAEQLQAALSTPTLFETWRNKQEEPDDVDPALGLIDPSARVTGEQRDLRINLLATTSIPSDIFKQRMRMLAGTHWELRDVRPA